jgi:hypothetical protein
MTVNEQKLPPRESIEMAGVPIEKARWIFMGLQQMWQGWYGLPGPVVEQVKKDLPALVELMQWFAKGEGLEQGEQDDE